MGISGLACLGFWGLGLQIDFDEVAGGFIVVLLDVEDQLVLQIVVLTHLFEVVFGLF